MTAPNHALTGALIGLTISNPWLALPLAFLSHFVCDAIPHYDQPDNPADRIASSKRFVFEQLIVGALLCFLLVLCLALTRPTHWMLAAICAFLATSPDLFWAPRFFYARRTGKDRGATNAFLRFHSWIQWRTGPKLIWLEAVWFVVVGGLVLAKL